MFKHTLVPIMDLSHIINQKLILCGGFSTELISQGCSIDGDPLWSARALVEQPDKVLQVHKAFLMAGAQAIITGTYQASIPGYCKHLPCTLQEAQKYFSLAVELANTAIEQVMGTPKQLNQLPLIIATIGPYAIYLHDSSEYNGHYLDKLSIEDLKDYHRQHVAVYENTSIDFILFETIPGLKETEAIISLIKEFPTRNFMASFCCKDGLHLSNGDKFRDAIALIIESEQVLCIGINCTAPVYIESLLTSIKDITHNKVIFVFPNSGEEWAGDKWVASCTANEEVVKYIPVWAELGVKWFGGCCRVYPQYLKEIAKAVHKLKSNSTAL